MSDADPKAAVDGDAIEAVAQLLSRRVGLRLDHAIRARLVSAVRDEANRLGLSASAYAASLAGDELALQDLLNRVTVQETAFFRDPGQFVALATEVLPALRAEGAPVRIWSAGCANGQEAYSLAIALDESGIDDWQVIATDLSTEALARTRLGRYFDREVAGLSAARRHRYLVPAPGPDASDGTTHQWQIRSDLRDRVHVVRHNLVADRPPFPIGSCQVVFCRNVLIYFDRDNTVALLDSLSTWLPAGGHLFLGYSESLWDVPNDFELVRLGDAFVYRNAIGSGRKGKATREGVSAQDRSRGRHDSNHERSQQRVPAHVEQRVEVRLQADTDESNQARRSEPAPATSAKEGTHKAAEPALPATAHELFVQGEGALAEGNPVAAIAVFRQATYLEPDNPVAYLHLGLALDVHGDDVAARRAFAAGRAALGRCDRASVEALLEGYQFDELARVLDQRARTR